MKNKKLILTLLIIVFILTGFLVYTNFCPQELKIGHLTDIHIWAEKDDNGQPTNPERLLYDAINQINNIKNFNITIITGDVADTPNVELFSHVVSIFNNLKKPWYFALGNHDRNLGIQIPREPLLEVLKEKNHNGMPHTRYYSFQPKKGYTFIALDGSDYGIDDEQIAYLSAVLDLTPKDVIVIFLHTPLVPPVDSMFSHAAWNADKVVSVLKAHSQPIMVLAGHYHATKIIQDGNILYVASPSLRYAQEFRIIDIKNYKNKVVFDFDYKETTIKELISNPKERFSGEKSDEIVTITMEKQNK
ncbi:metallophosphoesterase [bacterium]|nr:metallophosphoesterase [bacterium]